jgi:hypothetical protein
MIYFSAFKRVSSIKLMANIASVNTIVISIKPMVLGNFKKRTLIYPNNAATETSIEIIKK